MLLHFYIGRRTSTVSGEDILPEVAVALLVAAVLQGMEDEIAVHQSVKAGTRKSIMIT